MVLVVPYFDFTMLTRLRISMGFLTKQSTSSKFGHSLLKSLIDSSYAEEMRMTLVSILLQAAIVLYTKLHLATKIYLQRFSQ